MVYISKVYTRFGDAGQTMLSDGSTVAKHSPRVASYGEVDELNALIGLLRLAVAEERDGAREFAEVPVLYTDSSHQTVRSLGRGLRLSPTCLQRGEVNPLGISARIRPCGFARRVACVALPAGPQRVEQILPTGALEIVDIAADALVQSRARAVEPSRERIVGPRR